MSFDTPNGTRGARQPTFGRLMRWVNGFVMSRIRRKSGKTMGMNALVLTTIGRKSGEPQYRRVGGPAARRATGSGVGAHRQ